MTPYLDLSAQSPIPYFLSGIQTASFLISGLFFFHHWKKTSEQFFLLFGLGCWMFAIERIPLLWFEPQMEPWTWCHLFRLVGFTLILMAAGRANTRRTQESKKNIGRAR